MHAKLLQHGLSKDLPMQILWFKHGAVSIYIIISVQFCSRIKFPMKVMDTYFWLITAGTQASAASFTLFPYHTIIYYKLKPGHL